MFAFLKKSDKEKEDDYNLDKREQVKILRIKIKNRVLDSLTPDYIKWRLPELYYSMRDQWIRALRGDELNGVPEPKGVLEEFLPYITAGGFVLMFIVIIWRT